MGFKYFVYVNKGDSRTRIHRFDCKGACKNLNLTKQTQQMSNNGIWYGFHKLVEATNFANSTGLKDIAAHSCV